ncbi:MAG: glucosyl transferase, partial [Ignavibacteriaceae bacterium]|nr:glucosyl transferase [Ignavibacteriaceae bacterium]
TIFAFNQNDIWFSAFVRYDGQKFIELPISPILTGWSINKIWGSSSSNLYVVGNNGNIVFYNGTSWSRIESGTDLNIGDIWGITDDSGGYNKYIAADNAMLKLDEDNNLSRIDAEPGMILNSVWGISNRLIYTAGDGIVLYKNNNWEKIYSQGVNTIYRIRGQYYNDICGIGSPGSIIYHFNGYSWASINPDPNNRYRSIDIKENTIAVSGYQGEKAAITILRRNN